MKREKERGNKHGKVMSVGETGYLGDTGNWVRGMWAFFKIFLQILCRLETVSKYLLQNNNY